MDLEKLNMEYTTFKSNLETTRREIDTLKSKADDLADDKVIWEGKFTEAKRARNAAKMRVAESKLEGIRVDTENVKKEAINKGEMLKELQQKIEERITTIKQNPEMKKHLEEVMSKKYTREAARREKEKEVTTKAKELITAHPALGNNLKGMIVAKKEIRKLEEELKELKNPSTGVYINPIRANEIIGTLLPQAQSKLGINKASFMSYITRKGIEITEQQIEQLTSKNFSIDGKGNINLIANLDRQIKGYEKSIKDYKTAANHAKGIEEVPEPEDKTKWYQLIKRFKNWNEKRKQKDLPFPAEDEKMKEIREKFRHSLKHDVVKDIVNQMETDGLQEAKKERKEDNREI